MSRQYLTGNDVYGWFQYGAKEVRENRKYLNDINVFPVADGDTGSNLVSTLQAMVDKTNQKTGFNSMLHAFSQTGLAYARGNSGIIFASYINSLATEASPFERIDLSDFSQIAYKAVKGMYQAIDQPVEGTIISVIKDWASFLNQNHHHYTGFLEFFRDAHQTAVQSLERTKGQLEVLRKNNVVDAGAAGFIMFMEGINRFLASDSPAEPIYSGEKISLHSEQEQMPEKLAFRFCTTVVVEAETEVLETGFVDRIKADLRDLGDSLLATAIGNKVKIHVHSNTPDLVVERLRQRGRVVEQIVDDMELQSRIIHNRVSPIGILTDSIGDIPDEFMLSQQIPVLPLGLLMEDIIYLDKTTIRLKQLFERLKTTSQHPTSSQPEPARITQFLQWAAEHFESLIFISVSSKMSGTYQAVAKEAKRLQAEGIKITVIDSLMNSGAQGLLVKVAAEARSSGMTHDEIVAEVQQKIGKTKIYVCLNTLEYAVRGGRIPNTFGKIGIKVGLKAIMSIDEYGNGIAFGASLSQKGVTSKIMKLVEEAMQNGGIADYSIVHADNLPLALQYKEWMRSKIGKEPAFVTEISSIVASNSGPGTVAVCITKK